MSETIDYADVGMKCGLEVHQQLLTERKLFCHCPAGRYTTTHDGAVLRHMRPTLSELGEYDGTALMEFKTRKNIIYLLHESNVCTYEMDDTPPFLLNTHSLDIAIELSLLLGCDIVDEVHIARKQYLDGSIPTGFQRTAIVGVGGRIPFCGRWLTITQVSLEEDSCREVLDRGHLIVWRADRLGMPLIETVTGPDLRTPEEAAEAILLVGRVCRSTGHVRTGMGASRQDINVSVRGGTRVEIKGVPQASWAPRLVHGETVRQVNLLRLRDELERRGFTGPQSLAIEHRDVTALVAASHFPSLRRETWESYATESERHQQYELGKGPFCVRAVKLPGLRFTLNWPTQPDVPFAHELAGRIRVIACLDMQPVLLQSDKWPDYEGSKLELTRLRKRLRCEPEDGLAIVWGPEEDTVTAAEEIRLRYVAAIEGVPAETRQAFADGSTDFERILPGPNRMYPDTDSPPHRVTNEHVAQLRSGLPPPPWERERRYLAAGVPQATFFYLVRRNIARLVDLITGQTGSDVKFTALFFGERVKALRRSGVAVDQVADERWLELFEEFQRCPVLQEDANGIVLHMIREPAAPVAELIRRAGWGQAPAGWQAAARELFATRCLSHPDGTAEQRRKFLMGQAMARWRGRVPAAQLLAELQLIEEVRQ